MKNINPIPVRTICVVDKENKTEIRVTNRILLRSLIVIWFVVLLALPLFDIWLRNTNYTSGKTIFMVAGYVVGLLLIGVVFIGILKAFQVIISLDDANLLLEKPASKKWKLSDLQNLTCKKECVVVESSHGEEEIIGKAMGYPEKKLLLLINYLNDEIKKRKHISQE